MRDLVVDMRRDQLRHVGTRFASGRNNDLEDGCQRATVGLLGTFFW